MGDLVRWPTVAPYGTVYTYPGVSAVHIMISLVLDLQHLATTQNCMYNEYSQHQKLQSNSMLSVKQVPCGRVGYEIHATCVPAWDPYIVKVMHSL